MATLVGFLAYISAAAVLAGYFLTDIGKQYYLIPVGAGIAVLAGIVDNMRRKH